MVVEKVENFPNFVHPFLNNKLPGAIGSNYPKSADLGLHQWHSLKHRFQSGYDIPDQCVGGSELR